MHLNLYEYICIAFKNVQNQTCAVFVENPYTPSLQNCNNVLMSTVHVELRFLEH